jgi:hypothetical protein
MDSQPQETQQIKEITKPYSINTNIKLGRVDQFGMIAALASLRPRVQIPPRPPRALLNLLVS